MAKTPTGSKANEAPEEDLTPYPTQAQNDAARLGQRIPDSAEAEPEADAPATDGDSAAATAAAARKKAGETPADRQTQADTGAAYKTR